MEIGEIVSKLVNLFGDQCQPYIHNDKSEVKNLLTDSRNHFSPEDTLFFAIKTDGGNDGHNYISQLIEKGVRNFIVRTIPSDCLNKKDTNFILVPDVISALSEIGRSHRRNAKEIVAITGSRGKTTLKEILFQLLEPYKNISRSPRSYNSKIGVPLSLWQISPDTDVAIIEAGISESGEMERLSKTIDPDTVILTNIGEAHSKGFSSMKEKAIEKVKLASSTNVKTVIYPLDSSFWEEAVKSLPKNKKLIRWSLQNKEAELFIRIVEDCDSEIKQLEYTWEGKNHKIEIAAEKNYDLENAANALALMLSEKFSHAVIEERFKQLNKIKTRLNVSEGINGCSVILDSYTSDLSSLLPAIDFTWRRKMPHQTFTLIISDLHHEGKNVDETYRSIARIVADNKINKFIGIGETFGSKSSLFPGNSQFFKDTDSFLSTISASDFNDEIILLKGSPEFDIAKIYEMLEAKKHETVLEVNLDALLRNYNFFRSKIPSGTGIIAMVKASGYGVGSYEIAKTLQDAGASYLAVAALDEGVDLRNRGIMMPILIMNPRAANYKSLFNNQLEPVIYSLSMLKSFLTEAEKNNLGEYPVHLKLDTGMHRMGFLDYEMEEVSSLLKSTKNIKVASIFSHLATADCLDMDSFTIQQLERFETMSSELIKRLGYPVKRHILNSAGIVRFPQFSYDLVRLGIGLYGCNTLPPEIEPPLSPVASLRSVIICIREINGREAVGYGRNGKIKGKAKIATIPIGYADGMNRKFGNGALKVLVNGHTVPTIGNICMDATMLDVTDIDCKEGDTVEIFGEKISVQVLADTLDTIPYEILTSVSPRVKRIYYRE